MPQKNLSTEIAGVGPTARFRAARSVLQDAIASRAFPGCAFGVLAAAEIQAIDGLGHFTYGSGTPSVVAPETSYDVASLTKVVATTAATMLLVQRGKLSIETPLRKLLPKFAAGRAPSDPARHITLRNLLAHNSGLPGYKEFFHTATTPAALLSACLKLPLVETPEAHAEYSDPGFILLGKALEQSVGETLDRWTTREIFQPLGMEATRFCPKRSERAAIPPTEEDHTFRKQRIQGEVQDENAWVLGGVAGHAGLFSNVPDLLRFAAAILAAAKSSDAVDMRQSPFTAEIINCFAERQLPPGSSRALGWDTPSENSSSGKLFSSRSIGHLGFSGCSLWIDLECDVAVVLLANRTWPDRSSQLIRQVRPAFHDAVREAL